MQAKVSTDLVPKGLRTEHLFIEPTGVTIFVVPVSSSVYCPACSGRCERVHSRYIRTISDLPWHGIPVVIQARVRRFFCDDPMCQRSIFCERLPEVAVRARKTGRLEDGLLAIVLGYVQRLVDGFRPVCEKDRA